MLKLLFRIAVLLTLLAAMIAGAFTPFYASYAGTKAPAEHYTRAAAKEFGARGISVTAVGPGPMDTPFFYGQESADAQAYHKSAAALSPFSKTGLTDIIAVTASAGTLQQLILPGIVLGSLSVAYIARLTRTTLVENLRADYVRTAKAKGLSRRDVIYHHALKNALIPVVTYIGIDFGGMLSGAILTETVFNWPGVGYEIYRAITQRDWPIVMANLPGIVFGLLAFATAL